MGNYWQHQVGFGAINETKTSSTGTAAQVYISPRAPSMIGMVLQTSMSGTQTANIFEVRDANGTAVFYVTAAGTLCGSIVSAFAEGSSAAAGMYFTGDADTGLYHPAANQIGFTLGETVVGLFTATAVAFTGTLKATGAMSAGGAFTSQSSATFTHAGNFKSTLDVDGAMSAGGLFTAQSSATITHAVNCLSTLDADGAVSAGGLFTAQSSAAITHAILAASTIDATGAATFVTTATVGHALKASSTIDVTGTATLVGTASVGDLVLVRQVRFANLTSAGAATATFGTAPTIGACVFYKVLLQDGSQGYVPLFPVA